MTGENTILYGLGAIKGVGRGAVEAVIAARSKNGSFTSLREFCRRVDLEKVNRRALEAMLTAGSFDVLGYSRRGLVQEMPEAIKSADAEDRAGGAGQH